MASEASGQETFGEFVERLSEEYPQLSNLAHLVTGRYPPNSRCLKWGTSNVVDVVVFDIFRSDSDQTQSAPIHIHDIPALREYVTTDIPQDSSMRLFLVQNLTGPVIDILGSTYGCNPMLFSEHIRTIDSRKLTKFDEKGEPCGEVNAHSLSDEILKAPSDYRHMHYFSIPFYRCFPGRLSKARIDRHSRNNVLFRQSRDGLLEERVSGTVKHLDSSNAHIGILLFDPVVTEGSTFKGDNCLRKGIFDQIPDFGTATSPRKFSSPGNSLRNALLQSLQNLDFQKTVYQDASVILCQLLSFVSREWLLLMESISTNIWALESVSSLSEGNLHLQDLAVALDTVSSMNNMLRHTLATVEARALKIPLNKPTSELAKDVHDDFLDFLRRTEVLLENYQKDIAAAAAIRSLAESEKSIAQSNRIAALTVIATFYIPLSFASSFLGMNVTSFSSQNTPLWLFFAIAVPLTLISLFAVGQWNRLTKHLDDLPARAFKACISAPILLFSRLKAAFRRLRIRTEKKGSDV